MQVDNTASLFNQYRHLIQKGVRDAILLKGQHPVVYVNRKSGKVSALPRHCEINEFLAQKICRDLEIPQP